MVPVRKCVVVCPGDMVRSSLAASHPGCRGSGVKPNGWCLPLYRRILQGCGGTGKTGAKEKRLYTAGPGTVKEKSAPTVEAWRADCGSDRRRSGDLTIFSRTLYQLSYRALRIEADTQRPRLRDEFLHLNHAARATPTGLEPATSAVTGRRANQLRYGALLDSAGV